MKVGYFLCADLMGFSCIVKNLDKDELDKRLEEWITLVKDLAASNKIKDFQIISDTVFAGVGKKRSELKKLISFGRGLLNHGIEKSFLIRGAITYGEFSWGQVVYGRAVINAHKLEMSQNWIGIALDCMKSDFSSEDFSELNIVCYPVPLYNSLMKLSVAVIWDVPKFDDLARYSTSGGLTVKGDALDSKWADKIQNTVIFGLYLEIAKRINTGLHQYHGRHPIEFIDNNFRGMLAHNSKLAQK